MEDKKPSAEQKFEHGSMCLTYTMLKRQEKERWHWTSNPAILVEFHCHAEDFSENHPVRVHSHLSPTYLHLIWGYKTNAAKGFQFFSLPVVYVWFKESQFNTIVKELNYLQSSSKPRGLYIAVWRLIRILAFIQQFWMRTCILRCLFPTNLITAVIWINVH